MAVWFRRVLACILREVLQVKLRPHAPSESSRYSRLLPPFSYGNDEEAQAKMTELGLSMFADETAMPDCEQIKTPVPAGYTYFGQFIAHDLTLDDTSLTSAGKHEPHDIVNNRTPWLDLDSVYGNGPESKTDGYLYNGASFCLGKVTNPNGILFDVPIEDGKPAMVDRRNRENIIIRQLHAIFLLLHNAAVEQLRREVRESELFEKARERVRWIYQWLVRKDFLETVCRPDVCEAVRKAPCIEWPKDQFSISVEFSHAAFRFGHSMVRAGYLLNSLTDEVPLPLLFGSMNMKPLDPIMAIDWRHFLTSEPSMRIDTQIVEPLKKVPDDDLKLFVKALGSETPIELAVRTLRRGAAMRLPTGQQVRDALDPCAIISPPSPEYQVSPWQKLQSLGLENQTPLWYYILLEAQLDENGLRLGRVGSRLVAEVIEAALRYDSKSFLNQKDPAWTPIWETPGGAVPIENLLDVAIIVGLERRRAS